MVRCGAVRFIMVYLISAYSRLGQLVSAYASIVQRRTLYYNSLWKTWVHRALLQLAWAHLSSIRCTSIRFNSTKLFKLLNAWASSSMMVLYRYRIDCNFNHIIVPHTVDSLPIIMQQDLGSIAFSEQENRVLAARGRSCQSLCKPEIGFRSVIVSVPLSWGVVMEGIAIEDLLHLWICLQLGHNRGWLLHGRVTIHIMITIRVMVRLMGGPIARAWLTIKPMHVPN